MFVAFLRLGLTSFGGPVAHLAFFRTEFVERRRWLSEARYAEIVALCQFLPGPASSQVGMALGWQQAGWRGSLAAWLGFTLPSAVLMTALALGLAARPQGLEGAVLKGLELAAVAVVAQASWAMGRALCPDLPRVVMAALTAMAVLTLPGVGTQLLAMAVCALIGAGGLRTRVGASLPVAANPSSTAVPRECPVPWRGGVVALAVFVGVLLLTPGLARGLDAPALATFDAFFRAGSLVFGGGHVVLPLLQAAVVPSGAVSAESFLAGYGAAQAVPGPLFTFAAYLGAALDPRVAGVSGVAGAALCLLAVFLPAWLLVVGAMPFWDTLRRDARARAALAGVNAGVVGLLAAAFVGPVWQGAISGPRDIAIATAALGLLTWARLSPVLVVALAATVGALLA